VGHPFRWRDGGIGGSVFLVFHCFCQKTTDQESFGLAFVIGHVIAIEYTTNFRKEAFSF
jgi:hypothetical protein